MRRGDVEAEVSALHRQRATLDHRGRHPGKGARPGVRRRIHAPRPLRLHRKRRARGHQAPPQSEAGIGPDRREVVRGATSPSRAGGAVRRGARDRWPRCAPACTPLHSRSIWPSPSTRSGRYTRGWEFHRYMSGMGQDSGKSAAVTVYWCCALAESWSSLRSPQSTAPSKVSRQIASTRGPRHAARLPRPRAPRLPATGGAGSYDSRCRFP